MKSTGSRITPNTKKSSGETYLRIHLNFFDMAERSSCLPQFVRVSRHSANGPSARSMEDEADFRFATKTNLCDKLSSMQRLSPEWPEQAFPGCRKLLV